MLLFGGCIRSPQGPTSLRRKNAQGMDRIRTLFPDDADEGRPALRPLDRPRVDVGFLALNVALPAVCAILLAHYVHWAAALAALAVFVFWRRTALLVFWVRLYQALAPEYIRRACTFHPTCSEYMILAVEKYGFFSGVRKGCSRLNRCGFESGEDWP